jgi:imidazolonepropionase-like amidohydrolase
MLSVLASLAAAASAVVSVAQTPSEPAVVFTDVAVIPMDRQRVLEAQHVVVAGGRIAVIGPAATTRLPAGATRIDGRGKYLMPGIAEMHVHMPSEQNPAAVDIMALYVLTGATTVRAMNGTPFQLELRRRIEAGEVLGPTVFAVAPPFSGQSVGTPDEERRKVREFKAAGYDVLKIYPGIPKETYDAIVATAREVGIPYAGHVPPEVGLRHAIASGQSVEHLDGYVETSRGEDAAIAELARATRDAGTWSSATMDVWKTILGTRSIDELRRRPELVYMRPEVTEAWVKQTAQFARGSGSFWQAALERVGMRQSPAQIVALRDRILQALHRAGAKLVLGSDSPQVFSVPGFSLAREMRAMVEAGVPTYAVLEAGTKNPAGFFGQEAEFGTVEVGKRADLILVDGNPLVDIRNVHRQAGVMVRGQWLPKAEIDRRLAEIAARAGGPAGRQAGGP